MFGPVARPECELGFGIVWVPIGSGWGVNLGVERNSNDYTLQKNPIDRVELRSKLRLNQLGL